MANCYMDCLIDELNQEQVIATTKAAVLREVLAEEKRRLEFFKAELEKDREEFLKKLKIWYPPPKPCTCAEQIPKVAFLERMENYRVFVSKKCADEPYPDDGVKPMSMYWTDCAVLKNDPDAGKYDCMLVDLDKRLLYDEQVLMQLEHVCLPRQICPCKTKKEGSKFPAGPLSYTTYYKGEVTMSNVKTKRENNSNMKLRRSDYIRNQFEPPTFCRAS